MTNRIRSNVNPNAPTQELLDANRSFNTVEEMNAAVKAHKASFKYALNDTMRDVLDLLARYSCKTVGVSYMKKALMAEELGKSPRTIRRATAALEELGIIRQVARKRIAGDKRQTSNLVVILPSNNTRGLNEETSGEVDDHAPCPPITTSQKALAEATKNNNKTTLDTKGAQATNGAAKTDASSETTQAPSKNVNQSTMLDASFLRKSLPTPLYAVLRPYFNALDLYNVAGAFFRGKASIDASLTIETHTAAYVDTLKACIFAHKVGKVKNLVAYIYRATQNTTSAILRRLNAQAVPNWLASNV